MKRIILFIFFIAVFSNDLFAQLEWILEPVVEYEDFRYDPAHSKQVIIVRNNYGRYGIQMKDGKYLYEVGTLKKAEFIYGSGTTYGITSGGDTVIINTYGKIISDDYQKIDFKHHTNLLIVKNNGLMGIIDSLGEVVADLKYISIQKKKKGYYIGKLPNGTNENIKLRETSEKFVSKTSMDKARKLDREFIKKRINVSRGYYFIYGLVNMDGDTIIKPDKYSFNSKTIDIKSRSIVLKEVKTKKYGIMNADGVIILPFEYDRIEYETMKFGYVICKKAGTYYNFNLDGTLNASFTGDKIIRYNNYPYYYAKKDGHYYILDSLFNQVVPFAIDKILKPYETSSYARFRINKKTGFYSFKTGFITEPKSINWSNLSNGNIYIQENDKFIIYNPHTGESKPAIKSYIFSQKGRYYFVKNKLKDERFKYASSFLDTDFNLIFGPVESSLTFLEGDFIMEYISRNNKKIHNIATGKSINISNEVRYKYDNILKLGPDQFCFLSQCMNPDKEVFTELKHEGNGIYIVRKNGKYGIYKGEKQIEAPRFDDLKHCFETIEVKLNGKWGLLKNPYYR